MEETKENRDKAVIEEKKNEKEDNHHKKSLNRRLVKIISSVLLVVVIFLAGFFGGRISTNQAPLAPVPLSNVVFINKDKGADITVDFSLFWTVWDLLKSKYVDSGKLDSRALFYGAIKGMMAATGDPYTTFFDPTENKQFGEEISGNFEGIGAELGIKNNVLTVVAPLQGSPAEKAGLKSGDEIIKIDGKNAADMTTDDAVNAIRGPKGTTVV